MTPYERATDRLARAVTKTFADSARLARLREMARRVPDETTLTVIRSWMAEAKETHHAY